MLATRLDSTELVLEAGCGACAIELSHKAVMFGTEGNTGSVHGCDNASDLVKREGLGLSLFLGCHVDWPAFRMLGEVCGEVDLSVSACEQKKSHGRRALCLRVFTYRSMILGSVVSRMQGDGCGDEGRVWEKQRVNCKLYEQKAA